MARPRKSIPAYRHHKPSGQARCTINGHDHWLGPWDTPESKRRYSEVLDRLARGEFDPISAALPTALPPATVSVNELCLRFIVDQFPKYRRPDGRESAECDCYRGVIRILQELYGETPVAEFGPLRLRKVREAMVDKGWCRKFVNKQTGRLRHLFRWGISWEMVPQSVAEALKSVEALRPGDTKAPERPARQAVPLEHVETIKARMRQRTRDLVDLLLFTGARAGELLSLRTSDLDQSGSIWKASIQQHKNRWRGQSRTLYFGPKGQLILRRYLKPDKPDARIFPIAVHTLSGAIARGCERHGIPHFTAHNLRHTAATVARDELGIEYAAAVLGHKTIDMTAHYSTGAEKRAVQAAKVLG